MNKKIFIAGIAPLFAISIFFAVQSVSAESEPIKTTAPLEPKVPRYSETCAHGHNGYDCKPGLGKRVVQLEIKVLALELKIDALKGLH